MPTGEGSELRVSFGETSLCHWSNLGEDHSHTNATPESFLEQNTLPSGDTGMTTPGAFVLSPHAHDGTFTITRSSSQESAGSIRSRLSELSDLSDARSPRSLGTSALRERLSPSGATILDRGQMAAAGARRPLDSSFVEGRTRIVTVSDGRVAMKAEVRPALQRPRPDNSIWSPSEADESADDEEREALASREFSASASTAWAHEMAEIKEEAARRSFGHEVIGAAVRDREAAERALLNASSPAGRRASAVRSVRGRSVDAESRRSSRVELSPFLKNSRMASMARSRAETIADTSAATSMDDSLVRVQQLQTSRTCDGSAQRSTTRNAPSGTGESLLARWHTRLKKEICKRTAHVWRVHVQAAVQARVSIFRLRWEGWRKIVSALSARRRLAVYVISIRLRISNAFEIWVALRVRSRVCHSLALLHTGSLLRRCLQRLGANAKGARAIVSVAATNRACQIQSLHRWLEAWRISTLATRHAIDSSDRHRARVIMRSIHAWLSALSRSRAGRTASAWMASGQGGRIKHRVLRHWHVLAGAAADCRRHNLRTGACNEAVHVTHTVGCRLICVHDAAFERLRSLRCLGYYRSRILISLHKVCRPMGWISHFA